MNNSNESAKFMFKAAYYDIRYVEEVKGAPNEQFDLAKKLQDKHIQVGSLNDTKEAHETYKIILKTEVFSDPRCHYYLMAKAVDHAGNKADEVSNIVLVPPTGIPVTTIPDTSTQNIVMVSSTEIPVTTTPDTSTQKLEMSTPETSTTMQTTENPDVTSTTPIGTTTDDIETAGFTIEIVCIIAGCLVFAAVLLGCILHCHKQNKKRSYPVTQ